MSVIVKGMEMPEECNACPLANYNMGTMYCKALPPSPKGYHVIRFEGKREDCPLIECRESLFSTDNARKFLKENPPKEGSKT